MTFEPSLTRRGLDWLLATCPHLDLVSAEWQDDGPWLLVTLGQLGDDGDLDPLGGGSWAWARHPYAIWRRTGAVYGMRDGAVDDDPLWQPE